MQFDHGTSAKERVGSFNSRFYCILIVSHFRLDLEMITSRHVVTSKSLFTMMLAHLGATMDLTNITLAY